MSFQTLSACLMVLQGFWDADQPDTFSPKIWFQRRAVGTLLTNCHESFAVFCELLIFILWLWFRRKEMCPGDKLPCQTCFSLWLQSKVFGRVAPAPQQADQLIISYREVLQSCMTTSKFKWSADARGDAQVASVSVITLFNNKHLSI